MRFKEPRRVEVALGLPPYRKRRCYYNWCTVQHANCTAHQLYIVWRCTWERERMLIVALHVISQTMQCHSQKEESPSNNARPKRDSFVQVFRWNPRRYKKSWTGQHNIWLSHGTNSSLPDSYRFLFVEEVYSQRNECATSHKAEGRDENYYTIHKIFFLIDVCKGKINFGTKQKKTKKIWLSAIVPPALKNEHESPESTRIKELPLCLFVQIRAIRVRIKCGGIIADNHKKNLFNPLNRPIGTCFSE